MTAYLALLRSINLGRHNKISMPDLRSLFESLGCSQVATYIQSGNVVFTLETGADVAIGSELERLIDENLGVETVLLIRSKSEIEAVVAGNPFQAPDYDVSNVHVTFLATAGESDLSSKTDASAYQPDRFVRSGREVYLYCPEGYGRTRLTNAFWERQLKTPATTRNWRTVTTLRDMFTGLG